MFCDKRYHFLYNVNLFRTASAIDPFFGYARCRGRCFLSFLKKFFSSKGQRIREQMTARLPTTAPLPECFKAPQQEKYRDGVPFWEGSKTFSNLADVPVNTKGFTCLGCEPGSAPDPFIVVFNDGQQLGLINPYVTVLNRAEPKSIQYSVESCGTFMFPQGIEAKKDEEGKRYVTVQVNGDTLGLRRNVKKQSDFYKVSYTSYEEIKTLSLQGTSFCFGNFGNCALPNHADEYEALWDCEMIVFRCDCGVIGNSMDFKHAAHGTTKVCMFYNIFFFFFVLTRSLVASDSKTSVFASLR